MKSDRIFGLIALAVALAYIVSATRIQTSLIVDPLGPKSFPILIGSLLAVGALWVLLKPDPEPEWPALAVAVKLGGAVMVLMGYAALALERAGFIPATAVAAGLISYQIRGHAAGAGATGIAIAVCLFVVFRTFLGLGLIAWPQFVAP